MAELPRVAQTNLQLFNQMRNAGYTPDDLRLAFRAYHLAADLFSGYYRSSGKPMTAHLVGTASILAELGAPASLIGTGLLHASYHHGRFRRPGAPVPESKRRRVREAIGREAEETLNRYTHFIWLDSTIPKILENIDSYGETDRQVLLIRLADKLDDQMDCEPLYSANAAWRTGIIREYGQEISEIARRLGYPQLGDWYELAVQQVLGTEVPDEVRTTKNWEYLLPSDPRWVHWIRSVWSNVSYRWYKRREGRA